MQRDVATALSGAAAGGAATIAMSLVMLAAKRTGIMSKLPPEIITEHAVDAADVPPPSEEQLDALTAVLHVGYGVAGGAVFGLLRRRLSISTVPLGILFGSLVWFLSYKGWVPALGIMPSPERDEPGRPEAMLVAHWVYGGVLGALVGRRREDG